MEPLSFGTHRLVHLDLKGAPPKISYLEKLLPYIKDIGATGILLEWEDTFPYSKELIQIGGLSNSAQASGAPYNIEEAKQILNIAEDCGLSIIPLVQTFGHMEFVLKHDEFHQLREVEPYPSSMCPSHSGSMALVRNLVKQIVAFHSNIQFIHIGADEVWHMGLCQACSKRVQNNKHGKVGLYLEHVTDVAQYIKETFPTLKIIIWDDMLRNVDVSILQEYYLDTLVEPMIWNYYRGVGFQLGGLLWEKYSSIWTHIWGASAFKGATGSSQLIPHLKHHVDNHEAWLTELGQHGGKVAQFRGIALTGWSRYDHYATLCELLPCAIPSLCLCMKTWLSGGFSSEIYRSVNEMLGYTETDCSLYMETPLRPLAIPPHLNFPGYEIYLVFEWFLNIRTKYRSIVDSDQVNTWFNQWQITNNYTNPMQLDAIMPVISSLLSELTELESYLKTRLEQIFFNHTNEELLGTLITPMRQHLRQMTSDCENQIAAGCRVRGQKRLIL